MRTKTYYMPDVGERYICTAKDSVFKGHVIRIDVVFDAHLLATHLEGIGIVPCFYLG